MKILMATAALTVLASTAGVNAQSAGPYYSNTIHQSVGGRDSRGFPKYYHGHRISRRHLPSTTGAGDMNSGEPPGPYYSNTIHQSKGGRDSRDFPKYEGK